MFSPNSLRGAIAALYLVATPALAQGSDAQDRYPVQTKVRYADLDLASPAGQEMFQRRIRHAASLACQSSLAGIDAARDRSRCMQEMQKDGKIQIASLIANNGTQVAVMTSQAQPSH